MINFLTPTICNQFNCTEITENYSGKKIKLLIIIWHFLVAQFNNLSRQIGFRHDFSKLMKFMELMGKRIMTALITKM